MEGVQEKILLSKGEAAQALSISEKKLWPLTQPRGPIQAVRLGNRVLYSPETLRSFYSERRTAEFGGELQHRYLGERPV